MDTRSDTVLFLQMRNGDAGGFSGLYDRYYESVLRFCIRLMRERARAEDVVQNVFLKLHSSQDGIRDGGSVQSWLFTAARNEAFNELGKKRTVEIDESAVWDGDQPDEALMTKQRDEAVDAAIARLRLPYREVILLRIYEQLSYEEIAAITQTTVASVKSRLFKARKALLLNLEPMFDDRNA